MAEKRFLAWLLLGLLLAIRPASADSWSEVGDAGDLPATAQVAQVARFLTRITGTIDPWCPTPPCDVDLFRVYLSGSPFSVLATSVDSCCLDPILYLFDESGLGVMANEECGADCDPLYSYPGVAFLEGEALPPGFYLLAVSVGCVDAPSARPFSVAGYVFPELCNSYFLHPPISPGGDQPLSGWDFEGAWIGSEEFYGDYRMDLVGVRTPEPAGGGAAAAALAALLLLRARRRPW